MKENLKIKYRVVFVVLIFSIVISTYESMSFSNRFVFGEKMVSLETSSKGPDHACKTNYFYPIRRRSWCEIRKEIGSNLKKVQDIMYFDSFDIDSCIAEMDKLTSNTIILKKKKLRIALTSIRMDMIHLNQVLIKRNSLNTISPVPKKELEQFDFAFKAGQDTIKKAYLKLISNYILLPDTVSIPEQQMRNDIRELRVLKCLKDKLDKWSSDQQNNIEGLVGEIDEYNKLSQELQQKIDVFFSENNQKQLKEKEQKTKEIDALRKSIEQNLHKIYRQYRII